MMWFGVNQKLMFGLCSTRLALRPPCLMFFRELDSIAKACDRGEEELAGNDAKMEEDIEQEDSVL